MHHSLVHRFFTNRLRATTCSLLLVSGVSLGMLPRGAAQTAPPAPVSPTPVGAAPATPAGISVAPASPTEATGTAAAAAGVPSNAVTTGSGSTNHLNPSGMPNPLVITDSAPVSGPAALVPTTAPRDYTLPPDLSAFGPNRTTDTLPLYGYDVFQPARQIIIARRALLTSPPRRFADGTGAGYGGYGSGSNSYGSNGYNFNGYPPDGYGGYGPGRYSGPRGYNSGPLTPGSPLPPGSAQAGGASQVGNAPYGPDPNGGEMTSPDSPAAQAQARRSVAGSGAFPGDTAQPGGAIQFPGSETYAPAGTTSALTGETADPASTPIRQCPGDGAAQLPAPAG